MNKKILTLAIAAMSMVSLGSFAQTPATGNSNTNATCTAVCPDGQACVNNDKMRGKKVRPAREKADLFAGLNLTEQQKSQLQQLNERKKAERQQQAQQRKEADKKAGADRRQARLDAKKAYLQEVKSILGPDNYVIFLENFYINGAHKDGKPFMKDGRKGPGRDGKNFSRNGRDGKNKHGNRSGNAGKGPKAMKGNRQATQAANTNS